MILITRFSGVRASLRVIGAVVIAISVGAGISTAKTDQGRQPMLNSVPFTKVHIGDRFWSGRLQTNREVTIPYCFGKCRETGRIDNFAKAGGLMEGPHIGHRYNDSDVFKVIEGAAYALSVEPDAELDSFLDDLISKIAAAQEDDGYLFTTRTIDPDSLARGSGDTRWSNIRDGHELYNVGHMYEAAVAHYLATGKRSLLDVAIRNADLIVREFGPGQRGDPPGHEEIEIGLVKLYGVTDDERYLKLAKFFIDRRGRADGRESYGIYAQDHLPVIEQHEPVGHAVRAMYLYCAMADVAAIAGEESYIAALDRIWDNMVQTRIYLTGGIGARQTGEAFGDPYEMPNATAYNETCAAVGNAMWNHRMNLLHGHAKYADVLERVLYNGLISGVSLSGDRFFYPNPLASSGTYHRSPWFSCSCCPVNIVRSVPSIAGYIYAQRADAIFVNLFIASTAELELPRNTVKIIQTTDYPWDGRISLSVTPERAARFDVNIRIPGWAMGSPVPSDLYEYIDSGVGEGGNPREIAFTVNGKAIPSPIIKDGYACLNRKWRAGDEISFEFRMPIRLVRAHEQVAENRNRLAMERGPIVYCLEAVDNGGHVRNICLPEETVLTTEHRPNLLGGVTVVRGNAFAMHQDEVDGAVTTTPIAFTAIPYYAWDHREAGEMAVWIAAVPELAEFIPPPTIASKSRVSASHCWEGDTVGALNDQIEPENSNDQEIPRLTWWDHRGTAEWVQYEFDEARWVSGVAVYWFDDTGVGQCRIPANWRLMFKKDDGWQPVPAASDYGVERDTYNKTEFDPITTSALRLEVQLKDGYSGGILEWRID